MKRANSKSIATAIAILSLAILSGCGSNPQSNTPINGANGLYPGGVGGMIGGGGCVPVSTPISFQAQGVYADYANLVMGRLPSTGQQVGQVVVGAGSMMANGGYNSYATYPGRVNGAMTLSLGQGNYGQVGLPYSGYPYGSSNVGMNTTPLMTGMNNMYSQYPAQNGYASSNWNAMTSSATGMIQLSAAAQQQIMYMVQSNPSMYGGYGGMTGMNGYNTGMMNMPGYNTGMTGMNGMYGMSSACVSSIAMNIGKWDSYRLIYGGTVYLYLNGSTHGYAATF